MKAAADYRPHPRSRQLIPGTNATIARKLESTRRRADAAVPHVNSTSVGSTDAPLSSVMVSSAPPRPEWISHWLLAPIWVNEAPSPVVPKPMKLNESPAAAPLPAKSMTMSPSASPTWNTKVSLPALPVSRSALPPPSRALSPALP
jgi:hypothetical protein